MNLNKMFHQ